jgi:photosystem II stability/assembly factor-like uncharacterized protein
LATKAKRSKTRGKSIRRETWGVRMALWAAALIGAVAVVGFLMLSRGGNDDEAPSSRFQTVHTFKTADYHSLAFHPTSGAVLFGHHGGLQKSEDGGQSWETIVDEANWDAMNTVFDPFSPDTIYVAGHNVFFRSDDCGETWQEVPQNLPSLDLHTFTASPNKDGRLYAIPAGEGLYGSDDSGQQWRLVSADVPLGSNSIVELADGTFLLGATDQGILRSEDGGKTWSQSRSGIDIGAIYAIKGDPNGERLYAGTDHGVYASNDGGKNWTNTALDDTWVIAVGVNPSDPQTVLAVNRNGELYRSIDGGASWD